MPPDPAPEKPASDREPAVIIPGQSNLRVFLTVFPSIMLPMFLAMIDQTIVAAALPAIAADFGSADQVSWIMVGYLVATTVAAPVYGRLGDVFGRKHLMFVALAFVSVASIICALAPRIEVLTLGRVLQGLGGGGLMALSQALVGETVLPRDRARYQGYLAAIAVTASTLGPVVGGLLTERFGWRAVFLANLPIAAIATVLVFRLPVRAPTAQAFRFDLPGLVYFTIFIISTLLMLQNAQRLDADVLPLVISLLAVAVAAVILLVRREQRASAPLLPLALFRNPAIWRSDALAACHGAMVVSLLTFLPIYLRVVHGETPARIGLLLLPITVGIGIGSMATGTIVARTGRTAIIPSIGLIVVVSLLLILSLRSPYLSTTELSIILTPISLFMGTVMGVVQVTVQTASGPTMLGTGSASVQFSRSLGASVGTALVGLMLFAVLAGTDPQALALFDVLLQEGSSGAAAVPGPEQLVLHAEIARAFRAAFLVITGFGTAALALAWSIPLRRI